MSVEAITWAFKVDAEDSSAKLVLISIADYADEDWRCWPSQKKIAQRCNMSIRAVRSALGRLETMGFLRREIRSRADGGRTTDLHVLLPHGDFVPGGDDVAKSSPLYQTQPLPPTAPTAGLTTLEPSEEEPPENHARDALAVRDVIWRDTPDASRKRSSKAQLLTALQAAARRGKKLTEIRDAVSAYFQDKDVAKEKHKFARGVHRVVNADFWENWHVQEPSNDLMFYQVQCSNWRKQMSYFLAGEDWNRASLGPRPDEPGCRIPLEIMAEFNYQPPRRAEG